MTEGLTDEALWARLYAGGVAPPLLLHASTSRVKLPNTETGSLEAQWHNRLRRFASVEVGLVRSYGGSALPSSSSSSLRGMGRAARFGGDSGIGGGADDDEDPVSGFLTEVRREMQLTPAHAITVVSRSATDRPRPLYLPTVTQLGLTRLAAVPDLLESAVGGATPLLARQWLKRLMMMPPPPAVADCIHDACRYLATASHSMPAYVASLPPVKITELLQAGSAAEGFYRDLASLLVPVIDTVERPELGPLCSQLLRVTNDTCVLRVDGQQLLEACRYALFQIQQAVDLSPGGGGGDDAEDDESDSDEGAAAEGETTAPAESSGVGGGGGGSFDASISSYDATVLSTADDLLEAALSRLFSRNEKFRSKVRRAVMEAEVERVEAAQERVRWALTVSEAFNHLSIESMCERRQAGSLMLFTLCARCTTSTMTSAPPLITLSCRHRKRRCDRRHRTP